MYLCKRGSVPEAVLRILHLSPAFFQSKNELVARELLKPEKDSKAQHSKGYLAEKDGELQESKTYWSLGSLVKHYIKEHVTSEKEKGELRSMVVELIGHDVTSLESTLPSEQTHEVEVTERVKARVAIVLCALYLDQSHRDIYEIVTKAMTRTSIAFSNDTINDLRREPVEPLIWLLDEPESEGLWTELDVGCVRKVLLTYICDCQFDDENIAHLLTLDACTTARLATLEAIRQICYIEEMPMFGRGGLKFVQIIARLVGLNEGSPVSVQVAASLALHAACWKAAQDRSARLIIDTPGVLDVIVSSLAIPNQRSDAIPRAAAYDLLSLAYRDEAVNRIILNKEGALVNHAARALANLPRTKSIAIKIGFQDRALDSLVKLLSAQDSPNVQAAAVGATRNLACFGALNLRIANQEGALAGVVKSLTVHNNPTLQEDAAGVVANLALTDSVAIMIGYDVGAVDSLVKLLYEQENPVLQGVAALAIGNIAVTEDITLRIVKDERALRGLVKCSAQQDHPDLQKRALGALSCIAAFEDAKPILQGTEGLLDSLMSLLGDGIDGTIQCRGANTLTLINPTAGKEARLTSGEAYQGRADAFMDLGMYSEALHDLDKAIDLLQGAGNIFGWRCSLKARLGDLEGALHDANEAVKVCNTDDKWITLKERGVLKRMSGDLEGALEDLDEGLILKPNEYMILKHRGFVKFLLNDEEGARADGERALTIRPYWVDQRRYENNSWLEAIPVEYLGFNLK